MSLVLEISAKDVLQALAYQTPNAQFNKAIEQAQQQLASSQDDFITLFGNAF